MVAKMSHNAIEMWGMLAYARVGMARYVEHGKKCRSLCSRLLSAPSDALPLVFFFYRRVPLHLFEDMGTHSAVSGRV